MSRELGSAMVGCPLAGATLVVEVARRDQRPLSAPVTVRLSGPARREGVAAGAPARASFEGLDPGAYAVTLAPSGEEADFEVTSEGHESVALARGARTALVVEIESEDSDLLTADLSLVDDLIDEGEGGDDGEDVEPEDWELIEGTLHGDDEGSEG